MGPGKKDVINHIIESNWNNYSEEEKIRIIHDAADLEPEQSIIAVLAGITSYQFSVRNEARKGLELIRLKISNFFSEYEDKEQYLKGMKVSASVCFRIYSLIRPDMTPKENNYYFTLLLDFEGKGPYFAYLAVYNETIPLGAMEQMMNTFSDYRRLALVDQYLQATPSARLKFGFSFIRLLKSIKQRDAVINFYAPLQQHKITEYTAVYINSWGEMFCRSFYSEKGFHSLEETKNDIMSRMVIKKFPLNTAYYFSKGVVR